MIESSIEFLSVLLTPCEGVTQRPQLESWGEISPLPGDSYISAVGGAMPPLDKKEGLKKGISIR